MNSSIQKEKAKQFWRFHHGAPLLVLPNVWDTASARIIEQAGFRAIATTSSGVAAALGYRDGQHMSREMMIEAIARITRVVECPVTADIEAGYGNSIEEVLQTVKAVIMTGAVGINIEDSLKQHEKALADIAYQVELIKALRELATSMDVPFVLFQRIFDIDANSTGHNHCFDRLKRLFNGIPITCLDICRDRTLDYPRDTCYRLDHHLPAHVLTIAITQSCGHPRT